MNREKIFGVLAKIEAVSGTDVVPTAAENAVRIVGVPTLTYGYLEPGLRNDVQTGGLGAAERAAPAARFGSIELTLEVRGAGVAYDDAPSVIVPEADPFWRMSGFSRTIDSTALAEHVRYTTLDSGMETGTLYLYSANKLFKLVGCVAAPKFNFEANKRGLLTFTVTGKLAADPTEVALPALTLSSVIPPLFHSGTYAIGAWTQASGSPLVMRSIGIDFGTAVSDRPSAGATDGLIGYLITDRIARQSAVVETVPLATFDPFTLSKAAGAALPISNYQVGTVQYNRMKVVTGRWEIEAPGDGSDRGLKTWSLAGNLARASEATTGRELYIQYD